MAYICFMFSVSFWQSGHHDAQNSIRTYCPRSELSAKPSGRLSVYILKSGAMVPYSSIPFPYSLSSSPPTVHEAMHSSAVRNAVSLIIKVLFMLPCLLFLPAGLLVCAVACRKV